MDARLAIITCAYSLILKYPIVETIESTRKEPEGGIGKWGFPEPNLVDRYRSDRCVKPKEAEVVDP